MMTRSGPRYMNRSEFFVRFDANGNVRFFKRLWRALAGTSEDYNKVCVLNPRDAAALGIDVAPGEVTKVIIITKPKHTPYRRAKR